MTTEEQLFRELESIGATLVEIRDLLKARPAANAGRSGGRSTDTRTGDLLAPDEPWARFPWPSFTNKSGKRRAVTLGESVGNEYGRKDLGWWAANYTPKPYKGNIGQSDQDFRDHLTAAAEWLNKAAAPAGHEQAPADRSPPPDSNQPPHYGTDPSVSF